MRHDRLVEGAAGGDDDRAAGVLQEKMPVLILTARTQEADQVLGFRLGADDYVTKPFGVLEILARVGALLRRANRYAALKTVERFGDIEVNQDTRTVTRSGSLVELAPMEFSLLVALIARRGATASRLDLLRDVWGHSAAVAAGPPAANPSA